MLTAVFIGMCVAMSTDTCMDMCVDMSVCVGNHSSIEKLAHGSIDRGKVHKIDKDGSIAKAENRTN